MRPDGPLVCRSAFRYLGVSFLLSMLVFGLLVAVSVFLHATFNAPDGAQNEAGFVLEPRLRLQLQPEDTGHLKSGRGSMGRMGAITIARS
jgi:hypothetical protein